MKKAKIKTKTKLTITGIKTFFQKKVTPFGTGAKIDCPKKYLNKKAYIIIK